ncbi:Protein of unknown function [Gryllus bimaculatus]|nr:Protein of unknown function [Gryllus bimaculatus]
MTCRRLQRDRPEAARFLPPPPPSQEAKALEAGALEPSQLARARTRATCAQVSMRLGAEEALRWGGEIICN